MDADRKSKIKLTLLRADITTLALDAIVNPANSFGLMSGGVAGVIRKIGGKEIESEAVAAAPIPIGRAVTTTAGKLPAKAVIHAPTMKNPAERTNIDNIRKATIAALAEADRKKFKTLAFPGMGTGVGRVPPEDAAKTMIDAIRSFAPKHLEEVQLVAYNSDLEDAFKKSMISNC